MAFLPASFRALGGRNEQGRNQIKVTPATAMHASQEYNTIRRPSMRRLHQCWLRPCMQPSTLLCTCSVVHTVSIDNLVFAKYAWTRPRSSLVVKAKYWTCQLNLSPSLLLLLLVKIIKYNDILLAKTTIP